MPAFVRQGEEQRRRHPHQTATRESALGNRRGNLRQGRVRDGVSHGLEDLNARTLDDTRDRAERSTQNPGRIDLWLAAVWIERGEDA